MYLSPCEFGDRTDGHDQRDRHEQFLPIERSHDLECRNLCIRRKKLMKWLCTHTTIIRYNPEEGHTFQGNRRREVDYFGSIWKEDQTLEDTPIHSVQTEVQTTPINIVRNRIQLLSRKWVVLPGNPLFQKRLHRTEDELSSNFPPQSQIQDQILCTKHIDTVAVKL